MIEYNWSGKSFTEAELLDAFDDMLDDVYPEVNIFESKISYSYMVKNVDPIMYRQAFLDWLDYNRIEEL